jgi:hypothetical protein
MRGIKSALHTMNIGFKLGAPASSQVRKAAISRRDAGAPSVGQFRTRESL